MEKDTIPVQRDTWIDNIKIFACILVVLGHFFGSMVDAQIISANDIYLWFDKTIYCFHVPLFFICSGYLFQKYSKIESLEMWKRHIGKKALSLGVPYFTFSTLTWMLKTIFSGSVNTKMSNGILYTLFLEPASPYWYLYCLFLIFFITPTFRNKKMAGVGFGLAMLTKIISIKGFRSDIYAVSIVLENAIWFVIGMCLAVTGYYSVISKKYNFINIFSGVLFLCLSILVHRFHVSFIGSNFLMGILACMSVIGMFAVFSKGHDQNRIMRFLAKYTMPIFLLHTIFAAPVRIVLLKQGINSPIIHTFFGIGISILGPIVSAMIMERTVVLNFFFCPTKYIKSKNKVI